MWYLMKRGLQMLVILVILSAALFGLLSSMPGNPIDLLITSNPNVKPEDVIRLKRLRGLDKPWYVQYVRWVFGYPEPARPPVILPVSEKIRPAAGSTQVSFDVTNYLIDQNYVPSPQDLLVWFTQIWPDWRSSKQASDIQEALNQLDISRVLLLLAEHDISMQNALVRLIEKNSAHNLRVRGLFGARADGLKVSKNIDLELDTNLWFVVTNSYGQEKVGTIALDTPHNAREVMVPMATLLVEDTEKPFSINLKKFLTDPSLVDGAQFSLTDKSPGSMTPQGVYTHQFTSSGQTAILAQIITADGRKTPFAFDVEHGVIGHEHKFNRGFIYFFAGDTGALGFSQTYKRPVYDLLFGAPAVCGDAKIDAGETCDDGNRDPGDGCGLNCHKEEQSFWARADAFVSGFIVRSGRIGNTIQLMLPALLLSLLIAIPLGVFSAYRQYSVLDYVINFLAFLGISLPVFWFGIMMIYVFAEIFQLFPAGGVQTPGIYGAGSKAIIIDRLQHAILPTIVLSIFYVGRWLRYMRASMLEVLPKDYIRTARAKGLSEKDVILKHAFRNALIPVVTVLALSIPSLFGGAVLTETVFSWPGVGRLQYEAVMNSDYYVAIIVFLVAAMLVMVGNLLADAIYVLVDPRMRK